MLPSPIIIYISRPLTNAELLDLMHRATLTLWETDAFRTFNSARAFDAFLRRPYAAVAFLDDEIGGFPLAAALRCDWVAVTPTAQLVVSSRARGRVGRRGTSQFTDDLSSVPHADVLTALAARASKRVLPMLVEIAENPGRAPHLATITAERAHTLGIADSLVPDGEDSLKWLRNWLGPRSLRAIDSAATLLRQNRSEAGERIEFARLFSTGEPQRGLLHFLEKTAAPFASEIIVETI